MICVHTVTSLSDKNYMHKVHLPLYAIIKPLYAIIKPLYAVIIPCCHYAGVKWSAKI